jgi:2-(1,2-epoxy-1,2-dihydrophenyl)acetyl-CoA isomerase
MSAPLRLESKDGIATITLDRPERLNALAHDMLDALVDALDAVKRGDDRVLVLTGEGKAFCAGADRSEMIERPPAEWEPIVDHYLDPVRQIADLDIPVIARLQGDTVGGGFGLAIASDFRIAAEGIRLGAPFVRIGLAGCDMSAGYYLHRVVAAEDLDAEVGKLAEQLRSGPPIALAFTKRAIRRSLDLDRDAEFDYEVFAQTNCIQTEDHHEGVRAFFDEKRAPVFKGR